MSSSRDGGSHGNLDPAAPISWWLCPRIYSPGFEGDRGSLGWTEGPQQPPSSVMLLGVVPALGGQHQSDHPCVVEAECRSHVGISGGSLLQIDFDKHGPEAASWRMQIIQHLPGKKKPRSPTARRGGTGGNTLSHPLPAAAAPCPTPPPPSRQVVGGMCVVTVPKGGWVGGWGGDTGGLAKGWSLPGHQSGQQNPRLCVHRGAHVHVCASPATRGEMPKASQFIPVHPRIASRWGRCEMKLREQLQAVSGLF